MNRLPDNPTDEISELLAGFALGALDREEHDFIARNLPRRPRWRQELAEYRRVATALAHVPEEQDVPLRARAAVLAEIAQLESSVPIGPQRTDSAPASTHTATDERPDTRRQGWKRAVPRIALAGAMPVVVVAIVFALHTVIMQGQMTEQQNELAEFAQRQEDTIDVLLSETQAPTMVELSATNEAPLARGRVFADPSQDSALLTVRFLPDLSDDQHYVVWIAGERNPPEYIRMGELKLGENDGGQITLAPTNLGQRVFVFITRESAPDNDQPQGPVVMSGGL